MKNNPNMNIRTLVFLFAIIFLDMLIHESGVSYNMNTFMYFSSFGKSLKLCINIFEYLKKNSIT